jgi:hypothetical protein
MEAQSISDVAKGCFRIYQCGHNWNFDCILPFYSQIGGTSTVNQKSERFE